MLLLALAAGYAESAADRVCLHHINGGLSLPPCRQLTVLTPAWQFLFAFLSAGADPKQRFADCFTDGIQYNTLCVTCALIVVHTAAQNLTH